jgi:cytochrome c biogenesis protein CcdA
MAIAILSFIAGVLTIAAPCILPLLPIIVGGSIASEDDDDKARFNRALIVTASLAASVIAFTLLLKATSALLGISQMFWQTISAIIVIALGINFLQPILWEKVSVKFQLYTGSNKALGKASRNKGVWSGVLTGVALGPVFNSCSPTYAFIVASVLPASFGRGLIYLALYAIGLSVALLLVALTGQGISRKLGLLTDPRGRFTKVLGIVFILVGLALLFGLDKKAQTYILEQGWYDPISQLEEKLR